MAVRDSRAYTNGISAALCNLVCTEQPESLKLSDASGSKSLVRTVAFSEYGRFQATFPSNSLSFHMKSNLVCND